MSIWFGTLIRDLFDKKMCYKATEKLSLDLLDRALIARLEMDPQKMT